MSLARIAANLDLSITTVSRALGGFADVAAATRARVEREAERIGYRPNHAARRLRRGRSEAVGVVLPNDPGQLQDPFFGRLLAVAGPLLARHNLDLLVTAARPGAEEARAYRNLVEGRRVDGVLLARTRCRDARIGYLLDRRIPFVAHGRTAETRAYAHIDIDGEAAFRAAAERLIGFGHRRIALINADPQYMFAHHRAAGWRAALAAAGLPADAALHAEPNEENGFRLTADLLARREPPTAILCATDRLAVGTLHALTHAGLRAGRGVSVIGYDNLPLARYTDPPLTTIEQHIERAAERMVEMLVALLGGADPSGMAELWQASLIARASDGPPRGDATNNNLNEESGGRYAAEDFKDA